MSIVLEQKSVYLSRTIPYILTDDDMLHKNAGNYSHQSKPLLHFFICC